eukprot:s1164_g1.t1
MLLPLLLLLGGAARLALSTKFDDTSLLTLPRQALRASLSNGSTEPFTLAGKSMYFIVLDRFARSGAQAEDYTYCSKSADWTNNTGGGYCGGTIAGILSKLDYIQGMGFDCIWITPPVDSNGYMGYDAINLFKINPHFGTKEDLKQLSKSLHDRGMCLVLDIVLNHMRSLKVNGKLNISSIVPFNKPEYYHQRGRQPNQGFEEYLLNGPPPAFDGSTDSKNLAALVKKRKASCGPTVPEQTECACLPGNTGPSCPSYNPQQQVEGWFGSLGDLNHSHPFVREQMLNWVTGLVADYDLDAFRLVSLVSGKTVSLQTHGDESVESLKVRAQRALGVGKGRLLSSTGSVLDGGAVVKKARLQQAEPLSLQVRRVDICAKKGAFAAILGDGSVVTWGDADCGGDSSGDGSVVTWGDADCSSGVRDHLKNVQQIQATCTAFAAILRDGSIVTWGNAGCGGDSSAVRGQLKNVQQIQATFDAFAAILGDGSVVTWGNAGMGGDSRDGSVVTWGDADCGGDSSGVQDQLKNVQQVQATEDAFAAILGDGSVVTWGDADCSSGVRDQLKNVQQIQATCRAFAAILGDGSIVTWGNAGCGGDSNSSNLDAFAAILGDGSVVTWGSADWGGDSTAVRDQLKNVQQMQATDFSFAAIRGDGSIVTWGNAGCGGDSSAVRGQLKNVQQVQATYSAFAAILGDGSVVTWGKADSGGGSSAMPLLRSREMAPS